MTIPHHPSLQVEEYGSTVAGTDLRESDMDVVVSLPEKTWEELFENVLGALSSPPAVGTIREIRHARVRAWRRESHSIFGCVVGL